MSLFRICGELELKPDNREEIKGRIAVREARARADFAEGDGWPYLSAEVADVESELDTSQEIGATSGRRMKRSFGIP